MRRASLVMMAVLGALALPSTASAVPTVTLTFDDGKNTQVDAANILAAAGLPATYYINSSAIGGPFFMTLDNLKAIASAPVGNEIGGHGVYHNDLSKLDANEQRRMVCDDRNWLLAQGFDVVSFAYPFSNAENGAATAVAECGYTNARVGFELRPDSPATCVTNENCSETIPPVDAFQIRTPEGANAATTLADLQQMVLNARPNGWVPILFHDVCAPSPECGTQGISITVFQQFVAWLAGRKAGGQNLVKTVRQVMNSAPAGPAVQSPPPTPHPSSNLLLNAGFEEPSPGPTDPFVTPARCWQEWRTPQSNYKGTYDLAPAPDVHGGAAALRAVYPGTEVLGFSSIVALPDMGTCAVPATVGHVYRFSGWYKSTGPAAVMHLVRPNSNGAWTPASTTTPLAPAADWTRFTVDLPAVPAGVTAIAPGIQFTAQTTFLLDDVELVDTVQAVDVTVQGPGRVTSAPAGISCPTDCTESYPLGSSVTLTATPTGKATFTGWSGACTGTAPCTVALTEARSVVAAFLDPANPQGVKHKLTIARAGAGKGTVEHDAEDQLQEGVQRPDPGEHQVRLTAKAQKGSVFLGWKGACKGAGACNVVLSKNVKVTALFEPLKPGLRIIKTGAGSVASGVRGISCGRKCSANFVRGTKVSLVAKPARGWRFVKWGGSCKGTKVRCTVNMTTVKTVRVTFARIRR